MRCNPINPALLAEIMQVVKDFPVALHRTAFQEGLLDGPEQALVFQGSSAVRLGTPGIKAAGVHCHHLAQPSNRMVSARITNEGVSYPDILAKYAAAFFKMSRSSVTRLSSAFRRFISTCWSSAFCRSAGRAL